MKTRPISSDARYTVQKEFCGQKEARFVARFCGEWVGQSISYPRRRSDCDGASLEASGRVNCF